MKPLRNSVFHRSFLSVNFSEVHTWYIFDESLKKFGLSSLFSECGLFQRSTLDTFPMKPLRSSVSHRNFLSVEFFRGLYEVHSDEAFEKFDLSSIFPECGIFQRSTLNTFPMKLLRSTDFHRCFLNVDFFRGSHLVYFDETLEKFGLSSIFSECWIFQGSTLITFPKKILRNSDFHRDFLSSEFFKGLY